jgi:small subunit ribosomal protein S27e
MRGYGSSGMKRENMMMPKPRSSFLSVQCAKCGEKAIVFSHTTTNISCKSCGELLAERSGSKANIIGKVLEVLDQ